jgi:hypothetical protein
MVTRTFRMPPEYDKILEEEAKVHGITVSALLNQMIRQYVLVSRFTERTPTITMSYGTFSPMLDAISDKDLVEIAEHTGAIIPEEGLLRHGLKLDFDSVNWFIDTVYGRYGNWFDSNQSILNGKERVNLSHQLNHKWSLYLGAFMGKMFMSILDMEPQIETRPNSVTLYLQPPKDSKLKRVIKKPK